MIKVKQTKKYSWPPHLTSTQMVASSTSRYIKQLQLQAKSAVVILVELTDYSVKFSEIDLCFMETIVKGDFIVRLVIFLIFT